MKAHTLFVVLCLLLVISTSSAQNCDIGCAIQGGAVLDRQGRDTTVQLIDSQLNYGNPDVGTFEMNIYYPSDRWQSAESNIWVRRNPRTIGLLTAAIHHTVFASRTGYNPIPLLVTPPSRRSVDDEDELWKEQESQTNNVRDQQSVDEQTSVREAPDDGFQLNYYGRAATAGFVIGSELEFDTWHHLAFACDSSDKNNVQLKFYLNGEEKNPSASTFRVDDNSACWDNDVDDYLSLGMFYQGALIPAGEFGGRYDNIRFWTTFRTQAEVDANRNVAVPADTAGLAQSWTFDDPSNPAASTVGTANSFGGAGNLINADLIACDQCAGEPDGPGPEDSATSPFNVDFGSRWPIYLGLLAFLCVAVGLFTMTARSVKKDHERIKENRERRRASSLQGPPPRIQSIATHATNDTAFTSETALTRGSFEEDGQSLMFSSASRWTRGEASSKGSSSKKSKKNKRRGSKSSKGTRRSSKSSKKSRGSSGGRRKSSVKRTSGSVPVIAPPGARRRSAGTSVSSKASHGSRKSSGSAGRRRSSGASRKSVGSHGNRRHSAASGKSGKSGKSGMSKASGISTISAISVWSAGSVFAKEVMATATPTGETSLRENITAVANSMTKWDFAIPVTLLQSTDALDVPTLSLALLYVFEASKLSGLPLVEWAIKREVANGGKFESISPSSLIISSIFKVKEAEEYLLNTLSPIRKAAEKGDSMSKLIATAVKTFTSSTKDVPPLVRASLSCFADSKLPQKSSERLVQDFVVTRWIIPALTKYKASKQSPEVQKALLGLSKALKDLTKGSATGDVEAAHGKVWRSWVSGELPSADSRAKCKGRRSDKNVEVYVGHLLYSVRQIRRTLEKNLDAIKGKTGKSGSAVVKDLEVMLRELGFKESRKSGVHSALMGL